MTLAWDIVACAFPQRRGFLFGSAPTAGDVDLANLSRWWTMRDHDAE